MKSCEHFNFEAQVNVSRLSKEDGGPIIQYYADIAVSCADCGLIFTFIGLPMGLSGNQPMCSLGGREARMPIEPSRDLEH